MIRIKYGPNTRGISEVEIQPLPTPTPSRSMKDPKKKPKHKQKCAPGRIREQKKNIAPTQDKETKLRIVPPQKKGLSSSQSKKELKSKARKGQRNANTSLLEKKKVFPPNIQVGRNTSASKEEKKGTKKRGTTAPPKEPVHK